MPADASGTVPETTLSSAEGVSSASANLQSSTFADIPQVQRYLQKFSNHERKHWFDNEERAPFSKDYVWVTSNLLGSGAFGRVYKCRRRGENEYRFAVKEMIFDVAGAPTSWADILQEVTVMREVQGVGGEHVVHLLDFFHSDCAAWLVLELLPGRSLRALMPMLQRLRPADHQHIVQQIAADVLEVLVRCHGGGIAHCDLKPENLFVNLRDALRLTNVLDWGLATHFKPGGTCTILKGSPDYLAPEVVSGWLRQYRGALPAPVRPDAADMWSLGVLLLEARFGRNPFRVHWWQHITTKQHLGSVRSLHKQWAAFSPAMSWVKRALAPVSDNERSFFNDLLAVDPEQRLTSRAAFDHPYIAHRSEGQEAAAFAGPSKALALGPQGLSPPHKAVSAVPHEEHVKAARVADTAYSIHIV